MRYRDQTERELVEKTSKRKLKKISFEITDNIKKEIRDDIAAKKQNKETF